MDKKLLLKLNIQFFAAGTTTASDMVDPEVLKDMISAKLPNAIRFAPLAKVDKSLVGRPGSTITVPSFRYIGDAIDVAEGVDFEETKLETTSEKFTIKKAGKGVRLTDEAILSGYGDPVGEAGKQMLLSIANKVDNDLLTAAKTAKLTYTTTAGITVDAVSSAIDVFNDEDDVATVLILNPKDATKLKKEAATDFGKASDLGDAILVKGTFGELFGAQVVRSNKVAVGEAFLIREGALGLLMKRDVEVEKERSTGNKTTLLTVDEHYGAHIYDDSKIVYLRPAPVEIP